jgi:hypothetical protein
MFDVFRRDWWPGLKPDISPERKMCSDCIYHSAAMAGWQFDRCYNPDADLGSVVRNDQRPTCADIRNSEKQCGRSARWFKERPQGEFDRCMACHAYAALETRTNLGAIRLTCLVCEAVYESEPQQRGTYCRSYGRIEPVSDQTPSAHASQTKQERP